LVGTQKTDRHLRGIRARFGGFARRNRRQIQRDQLINARFDGDKTEVAFSPTFDVWNAGGVELTCFYQRPSPRLQQFLPQSLIPLDGYIVFCRRREPGSAMAFLFFSNRGSWVSLPWFCISPQILSGGGSSSHAYKSLSLGEDFDLADQSARRYRFSPFRHSLFRHILRYRSSEVLLFDRCFRASIAIFSKFDFRVFNSHPLSMNFTISAQNQVRRQP